MQQRKKSSCPKPCPFITSTGPFIPASTGTIATGGFSGHTVATGTGSGSPVGGTVVLTGSFPNPLPPGSVTVASAANPQAAFAVAFVQTFTTLTITIPASLFIGAPAAVIIIKIAVPNCPVLETFVVITT